MININEMYVITDTMSAVRALSEKIRDIIDFSPKRLVIKDDLTRMREKILTPDDISIENILMFKETHEILMTSNILKEEMSYYLKLSILNIIGNAKIEHFLHLFLTENPFSKRYDEAIEIITSSSRIAKVGENSNYLLMNCLEGDTVSKRALSLKVFSEESNYNKSLHEYAEYCKSIFKTNETLIENMYIAPILYGKHIVFSGKDYWVQVIPKIVYPSAEDKDMLSIIDNGKACIKRDFSKNIEKLESDLGISLNLRNLDAAFMDTRYFESLPTKSKITSMEYEISENGVMIIDFNGNIDNKITAQIW